MIHKALYSRFLYIITLRFILQRIHSISTHDRKTTQKNERTQNENEEIKKKPTHSFYRNRQLLNNHLQIQDQNVYETQLEAVEKQEDLMISDKKKKLPKREKKNKNKDKNKSKPIFTH